MKEELTTALDHARKLSNTKTKFRNGYHFVRRGGSIRVFDILGRELPLSAAGELRLLMLWRAEEGH